MKQPKTLVPISERSGKAIVPRPTRKEVVEALVLKLAQEHEETCKKWAEEMAKIKEQIAKAFVPALSRELLDKVVDTESINYYHDKVVVNLNIPITELPSDLVDLVKQLNGLRDRRPGLFHRDSARAEMREALLADPARVKALSESKELALTLAHIKKNALFKEVRTHNGCAVLVHSRK